MTRFRRLIAIVLALILLNTTTALACGPFTLEAIFVYTVHPSYPLEKFAAGRLGVVQPSYARSYLFVAYRHLTPGYLTDFEQKAMVDLWQQRLSFNAGDESADPATWSQVWLQARKKVVTQDRGAIDVYRNREKPNEYESYVNCNRNSFENAASTLNARVAKYGADSVAVQSWVQIQDQVFSNCASGESIPEAAPATADALMRADRAYQIAAAHFYAAHFDEARKAFEAIAADSASPWQQTASYLVARALIRKASLGPPEQKQESLVAAESQLKKILDDKKFSQHHAAATRLANLVRQRLHPDKRVYELGSKLAIPIQNFELKQEVWDYTLLLDSRLDVDPPNPPAPARFDDLTDWIVTFQSSKPAALDRSLESWQSKRTDAWLVSALSKINGKHARGSELITAAMNVKPAAAAFATARFHAVRLLMESGKNDEARTLLDQLLKSNREQFDQSSLNLLTSKRMLLATSLSEFLTYAPRFPATLSWNDDGREIPVDDAEIEAEMKALRDAPRFDYDAGMILNQQMPLSVLKQAAQNTSLPRSLRRDLVQAVWLRAVILDDTKTADELVPALRELVPEMSELLTLYLSATPQTKKFSGIYAWLKFPGLEPVVDIGVGRRTPLHEQDSYRDNWWCGAAYQPAEEEKESETDSVASFTARNTQPLLFLSDAEKAAAEREWKTLKALGAVPNYLAREVIEFANNRSGGPKIAEALHLAVMSTRFGCTNQETGRWSKAAFDVLHKKYGDTPWAKKTPYWFKD
ncbi:MAG TPA: hypothetical protein VFS77_10615 [Pyrinomonadaceae bacterium]|nr:hypothetical protein [Pyrinomonadaceae bacterium]